MSDQEQFSELLKQLLDRFGPTLSFEDAATKVLNFPSVSAAYMARNRKKFPVRVDDVGGRLTVAAVSLAVFQTNGKHQGDQDSAPARKKPGRPRNAARAAKRLAEGGAL